eukprot:3194723-Alexandrium_andersonii.AAC.1
MPSRIQALASEAGPITREQVALVISFRMPVGHQVLEAPRRNAVDGVCMVLGQGVFDIAEAHGESLDQRCCLG